MHKRLIQTKGKVVTTAPLDVQLNYFCALVCVYVYFKLNSSPFLYIRALSPFCCVHALRLSAGDTLCVARESIFAPTRSQHHAESTFSRRPFTASERGGGASDNNLKTHEYSRPKFYSFCGAAIKSDRRQPLLEEWKYSIITPLVNINGRIFGLCFEPAVPRDPLCAQQQRGCDVREKATDRPTHQRNQTIEGNNSLHLHANAARRVKKGAGKSQ